MIEPRRLIVDYKRQRGFFESRENKIRLEFNEYVPHIDNKIFQIIMNKISAETFSVYPEMENTYRALSSYLARPVENLLLTSGADQAIFQIFNTFCETNDKIGLVEPNFSMYHHYATIIGCEVVGCYYDAIKWSIEEECIYDLIKKNCKIIVITTPNSYTGTTINKETLNNIIKKCFHAGILVLIDEVYFDFSSEDCSSFVDYYDNVICLRSFSKSVGLAGLRVGYILSNPKIIEHIYRTSFGVEINGVAAKAIEVLCNNSELYSSLVSEILDSKKYLYQELFSLGFQPQKTETNFIPIKPKDKQKLISYLKTHNVRVRKYPNISHFDDYISFTVGTKETSESIISLLKNFGDVN